MAGFYFIFLQIFLSAGLLRLSFLEIFKTTVTLPGINEAGEEVVTSKANAANMVGSLFSSGYSVLAVLLLIALSVSFLLGIVSMFLGDVKAVKIGGKIAFAVSLVLFVVCFIIAAKTGQRF